jgi:dihydropyrimidine dehydrogenase (NAD+) subunit PreA/dihydroorotate dehydrogenase (NAD+) catalytic subunit
MPYGVLSDAIEELDAYMPKRGATVSELLGSAADKVLVV